MKVSVLMLTAALALTMNAQAQDLVTSYLQAKKSIEIEVGRPLDSDEAAALSENLQQAARIRIQVLQHSQQDLEAFHVDGRPIEFTYMACIGIKGAFYFKRGLAFCSDVFGNLTRMSTRGKGMSAGLQGRGHVVIHAGRRNAMFGDYTNGRPASEAGDLYKYGKILGEFAGANIDFFAKANGENEKLFFVGLAKGYYYDFVNEVLTFTDL